MSRLIKAGEKERTTAPVGDARMETITRKKDWMVELVQQGERNPFPTPPA